MKANEDFTHYKQGILVDQQGHEWVYGGTANMTASGMGEKASSRLKGSKLFGTGRQLQQNEYYLTDNKEMIREWKFLATRAGIPGYANERALSEQRALPLVSTKHFKVISAGDRSTYFNEIYRQLETTEDISLTYTTLSDEGVVNRIINRSRLGARTHVLIGGTADSDINTQARVIEQLTEASKKYPSLEVAITRNPSHRNQMAVGHGKNAVSFLGDARASKSMSMGNPRGYSTMISTKLEDAGYAEYVHELIAKDGEFKKFAARPDRSKAVRGVRPPSSRRYDFMVDALMPRAADMPKPGAGQRWQYTIDPRVLYDANFMHFAMYMATSQFYGDMVKTRRNTDYDVIGYGGRVTYSPKRDRGGILSHLYASNYERSTGERMDYSTMPLEVRALDYLMQAPTAGYMLKAYVGKVYGAEASYMVEQRGNRGLLGSAIVNAGRYLDHHRYMTGLESFLYSGGYSPQAPSMKTEPYAEMARYLVDAGSNLGSFLMLYYSTHFLHSISASAEDYIVSSARQYQAKVMANAATSNSVGYKLYASGVSGTMSAFGKLKQLSMSVARFTFQHTVYPMVESLTGLKEARPYYNAVMEALDEPSLRAARMAKPDAVELTARMSLSKVTQAYSKLSSKIPLMNLFVEDITVHDDVYVRAGQVENTLAVKHLVSGRFRQAANSFRKANQYFANARASAYGYSTVSPERVGIRNAVRAFAATTVISGFIGDMLASKPLLLSDQIAAERVINEGKTYKREVSYLTPSYLLPQSLGEVTSSALGYFSLGIGYPMQVFQHQGTSAKIASLLGFGAGMAVTRGRGFGTFLAGIVGGSVAGGLTELLSGRGFTSFRQANKMFNVPRNVVVTKADGTQEEVGALTFMYSQGFRQFNSVRGALKSVTEFIANTPTALYRNTVKMIQADRDNFSWKVVTQQQAAAMTASDRMRQLDNEGFRGQITGDPGAVQGTIQKTLDIFRNFSVTAYKSEINQMSIDGLRIGWMGGPALFLSAATQGGRTSYAISFITPLPLQGSGTMSMPFYRMEKRGYKQLEYWLRGVKESNNYFDRLLYDAVSNKENSASSFASKIALNIMSLGYKPSTLVEAVAQLNVGAAAIAGPTLTALAVGTTFALANLAAKKHYQARELLLTGVKPPASSLFERVTGYLKYGQDTRVSLDPLTNIGNILTSETTSGASGISARRVVGTLLRGPGVAMRALMRVVTLPVTAPVGVLTGTASKVLGGSFSSGFMAPVRAGQSLATIGLSLMVFEAGRIVYNLHQRNYEGTPGSYIQSQINRYKIDYNDPNTPLGAVTSTFNKFMESGFRVLVNANSGERKISDVQPIIISRPTDSFAIEMNPIVGKFPVTPKGLAQRINWSIRKVLSAFSSESVIQGPEIVAMQHGYAAAQQTERDEDTTGFTRIKGRFSMGFGNLFTVASNKIAAVRPQNPQNKVLGGTSLAMATYGDYTMLTGFAPARKPAFMGRMFSSESPVYNLSPGLKLALRNRQALARTALVAWPAEMNDYLGGEKAYVGGYSRLSKQAYYTHYAMGRYDTQNNLVQGVRPLIVNPLRTAPGMKPYDSYDVAALAKEYAGYANRFYEKAKEVELFKLPDGIDQEFLATLEQSPTYRGIMAYIEGHKAAQQAAGMPITEMEDDSDTFDTLPFGMNKKILRPLSRNSSPEEFLLNFSNSEVNSNQQTRIGAIWLGFALGTAAMFAGHGIAAARTLLTISRDPALRAAYNVTKNLKADDPLKGFDIRRLMRAVEVTSAGKVLDPLTLEYNPSDASVLRMPRPGGGFSMLGAANGEPFGEGILPRGSVISGRARALGYQQIARAVIETYGDIKALAETKDVTRTLGTIRRLEIILESFAGHGPGSPAPPPGWSPGKRYLTAMNELQGIRTRLTAGGDFAKEINLFERTVFGVFRDFDDVMGLKPVDMPGFLNRAGLRASTFVGSIRKTFTFWKLRSVGAHVPEPQLGGTPPPPPPAVGIHEVRAGSIGTADPSHHTASTAQEERIASKNIQSATRITRFSSFMTGLGYGFRATALLASLALLSKSLLDTTESYENSVTFGLYGIGLGAFALGGISGIMKIADKAIVRPMLLSGAYGAVSNIAIAADPTISREARQTFREEGASELWKTFVLGGTLLATKKTSELAAAGAIALGAAKGGRVAGFAGLLVGGLVGWASFSLSSAVGKSQYEEALTKEKEGKELNWGDRVNKFFIGGLIDSIGWVQEHADKVDALKQLNTGVSAIFRTFNVGAAGYLNQSADYLLSMTLNKEYKKVSDKPLKFAAGLLNYWADTFVNTQIKAGLLESGDAGETSFSARHALWRSYSPIFYGVASERAWMSTAAKLEIAEQVRFTKRGIGASLLTVVAPEVLQSFSNTGLMSSSNDNLLNMSFASMYMARPRTGGGNVSAKRAFKFAPVPSVDQIIMGELHRRALMYETAVLGGANAMYNYMFTGGWSGFEVRSRTSAAERAEGAVPGRRTILSTLAEVTGGPVRTGSAGPVPEKYSAFITEASKRSGEAESFIRSIMQAETGGDYNERMVSPKNARGLMQIVPEAHDPTGKLNLFDPRTSIVTGANILAQFRRELVKKLGRAPTDLEVAAAYNAGVTGFMRSLRPGGKLPLETQRYIKQVEYYKYINEHFGSLKGIENTTDLAAYISKNLKMPKAEARDVAQRVRTQMARGGQYLPYDDPETYNQVSHFLGYAPTRKQRAELLHTAILRSTPSLTGFPVATERGISYNVTSPYLRDRGTHLHQGVDIQFYDTKTGSTNVPVVAFVGGRVIEKGVKGGYGNVVIVRTELKVKGKPVDILYGHLADDAANEVGVSVGDILVRGQRIGIQGSTGHSTGPHVHYEVRAGGTVLDPMHTPTATPTGSTQVPTAAQIEEYLSKNKDAAHSLPGAYTKMWKSFGFAENIAKSAETLYNQEFTRRGALLPGSTEPLRITLNPNAYTDTGERNEKRNYQDINKNANEDGKHRYDEDDDNDTTYGTISGLISGAFTAFMVWRIWKKVRKPSSVLDVPKPEDHDAVKGVDSLVKSFNSTLEKLAAGPDSVASRILLEDSAGSVSLHLAGHTLAAETADRTISPLSVVGVVATGAKNPTTAVLVSPEFIEAYDNIRTYDETTGRKEILRTLELIRKKLERKLEKDTENFTPEDTARLHEVTEQISLIEEERTKDIGTDLNKINNSVIQALEHLLSSTFLLDKESGGILDFAKHRHTKDGKTFTSAAPSVETLVKASILRSAALNMRARVMRGASQLNFLRLPFGFGEDRTGLAEGRLQQGVAAMQHLAKVAEHINRRFDQDPDTGRKRINYGERRANLLARLASHQGSATDQLQFLAEALIEGTGLKEGVDRTAIVNQVTEELVQMFTDIVKFGSGGPVQAPRNVKPGRRRGRGLLAKTNKIGDRVTIGRKGSSQEVNIDVEKTTQDLVNRTLENIFFLVNTPSPRGTAPSGRNGQQSLPFGQGGTGSDGLSGGTGDSGELGGSQAGSRGTGELTSSRTSPLNPSTGNLTPPSFTGGLNPNVYGKKTGKLPLPPGILPKLSHLYYKVKSTALKLAKRSILPAITLGSIALLGAPAEAATRIAHHAASGGGLSVFATMVAGTLGAGLLFLVDRRLRVVANRKLSGPQALENAYNKELIALSSDPNFIDRQNLLRKAKTTLAQMFPGAATSGAQYLLTPEEAQRLHYTRLGSASGAYYTRYPRRDRGFIVLSHKAIKDLERSFNKQPKVLSASESDSYSTLLHELRHSASNTIATQYNPSVAKDYYMKKVRSAIKRAGLLGALVHAPSIVKAYYYGSKQNKLMLYALEEATVEIGSVEHLREFVGRLTGHTVSTAPLVATYKFQRMFTRALLSLTDITSDTLYVEEDRVKLLSEKIAEKFRLNRSQATRIRKVINNYAVNVFVPSSYSSRFSIRRPVGSYKQSLKALDRLHRSLSSIARRDLPSFEILNDSSMVTVIDAELEKARRERGQRTSGIFGLLVGTGLALAAGMPAEAATLPFGHHVTSLADNALLMSQLGFSAAGILGWEGVKKLFGGNNKNQPLSSVVPASEAEPTRTALDFTTLKKDISRQITNRTYYHGQTHAPSGIPEASLHGSWWGGRGYYMAETVGQALDYAGLTVNSAGKTVRALVTKAKKQFGIVQKVRLNPTAQFIDFAQPAEVYKTEVRTMLQHTFETMLLHVNDSEKTSSKFNAELLRLLNALDTPDNKHNVEYFYKSAVEFMTSRFTAAEGLPPNFNSEVAVHTALRDSIVSQGYAGVRNTIFNENGQLVLMDSKEARETTVYAVVPGKRIKRLGALNLANLSEYTVQLLRYRASSDIIASARKPHHLFTTTIDKSSVSVARGFTYVRSTLKALQPKLLEKARQSLKRGAKPLALGLLGVGLALAAGMPAEAATHFRIETVVEPDLSKITTHYPSLINTLVPYLKFAAAGVFGATATALTASLVLKPRQTIDFLKTISARSVASLRHFVDTAKQLTAMQFALYETAKAVRSTLPREQRRGILPLPVILLNDIGVTNMPFSWDGMHTPRGMMAYINVRNKYTPYLLDIARQSRNKLGVASFEYREKSLERLLTTLHILSHEVHHEYSPRRRALARFGFDYDIKGHYATAPELALEEAAVETRAINVMPELIRRLRINVNSTTSVFSAYPEQRTMYNFLRDAAGLTDEQIYFTDRRVDLIKNAILRKHAAGNITRDMDLRLDFYTKRLVQEFAPKQDSVEMDKAVELINIYKTKIAKVLNISETSLPEVIPAEYSRNIEPYSHVAASTADRVSRLAKRAAERKGILGGRSGRLMSIAFTGLGLVAAATMPAEASSGFGTLITPEHFATLATSLLATAPVLGRLAYQTYRDRLQRASSQPGAISSLIRFAQKEARMLRLMLKMRADTRAAEQRAKYEWRSLPKTESASNLLPHELLDMELRTAAPETSTLARDAHTTRSGVVDFTAEKQAISDRLTSRAYYHGQDYRPYGIPELDVSGTWAEGAGFYVTPSRNDATDYSGVRGIKPSGWGHYSSAHYVQTFGFKPGARIMDFRAAPEVYEQEWREIIKSMYREMGVQDPNGKLAEQTYLELRSNAERTLEEVRRRSEKPGITSFTIHELMSTGIRELFAGIAAELLVDKYNKPSMFDNGDALKHLGNTTIERDGRTYIVAREAAYRAASTGARDIYLFTDRLFARTIASLGYAGYSMLLGRGWRAVERNVDQLIVVNPDELVEKAVHRYLKAGRSLVAVVARLSKDIAASSINPVVSAQRSVTDEPVKTPQAFSYTKRTFVPADEESRLVLGRAVRDFRKNPTPRSLNSLDQETLANRQRELIAARKQRRAVESVAEARREEVRSRTEATRGERPLQTLIEREEEINRQKQLKQDIWARLGTAGKPLERLQEAEERIQRTVERKEEIRSRLDKTSRERPMARQEQAEARIRRDIYQQRLANTSIMKSYEFSQQLGNPLFMLAMSVKSWMDFEDQKAKLHKQGYEMPFEQEVFFKASTGLFAVQAALEGYGRMVPLVTKRFGATTWAPKLAAVASKAALPLMVVVESSKTFVEYREAGTDRVARERALGHGVAGLSTIGILGLASAAAGFVVKTALTGAAAGTLAGGVGALPGAIAGTFAGIGIVLANIWAYGKINEHLVKSVDAHIDAKYRVGKSAAELSVRSTKELARVSSTSKQALPGTVSSSGSIEVEAVVSDKYERNVLDDVIENVDEFIQNVFYGKEAPAKSKNATVVVDTKANHGGVKSGAKDVPTGSTKDHSQRRTSKVEVDPQGKKVVIHQEHAGKKGKDDTLDRDYHRQGRSGSRDIPSAARKRAN